MAERRMFAKSLILGEFLTLSRGAQVLYIILNMYADDDGFVASVLSLLRMIGSNKRHLQELVEAELLILFPGGAGVITHWLIHNQIRKDRYKPTRFQQEKTMLTKDPNGIFRLPDGCQNADQPATQDRIGKDRIGKDRIGKDKGGNRGSPPRSSILTDLEESILEFYQKYCQDMPDCQYLDEGMRKKIRSLQEAGWTVQALEQAFRMAGECDFLKGENKEGWTCSLDWLCSGDNLHKVCGGKYQSYKKIPKLPTGATGCLGQAEQDALQKLLREG